MQEHGTGPSPGWFDADGAGTPTPFPSAPATDPADRPTLSQPTPQPAPQPTPQPAPQPTPQPAPQPTPQSAPQPTPPPPFSASTEAPLSTPAAGTPAAIPAASIPEPPAACPAVEAEPSAAATKLVDRAPRARSRSIGLVAARTFLALLSAAALTATGLGWATLGHANKQLTKTDVLADVPNTPQADDGATDILLVGSDSRTDAEGRPLPLKVLKELRTEATTGVNTDTIILIRIPHNGGRAYGLSIPRDTYVSIPGYRDDKINAAYGVLQDRTSTELRQQGNLDAASIAQQADEAGRRALIGAVQNVTGLKVDHYAEVNLYGFYLLTEAVGGVQVCLKHATADEDSGAKFEGGVQSISGGDALSFVRQRKNLPRGDLDRIVRQQVFMAALVKKILSTGTLTNSAAMSALLESAHKSVVLDQTWDISGFTQQMQGLSGGAVQFETIPVTSIDARSARGQSIVTVDRAQVHAFVDSLIRSPPTSGPAPNPSVRTTPTTGQHLGGGGLVALDGALGARPPQPTTPSPSGNPKPATTRPPAAATTTPDTTDAGVDSTPDSSAGDPAGAPGPISPDGIPCVN